MQTIYLDISNRGVIPVIYAKQGDVGRKVEVILTNSGLPYEPEAGSAFSAWYSGASGMGNYTDIGEKSAFSVSNNKVTVELISQMLQNAGEGFLCLVLSRANGDQIGLWNIRYICEGIPGAGSDPAKDYYTAFSQAVADLAYPDSSLSVAGKAADAAATGKALKSKAPAGYGLGDTSNMPILVNWGGINDVATKPGWYKVAFSLNSISNWTLRVDTDGANIFQEYKAVYNGNELIMHRACTDGAWGEFEWDNPPMVPGVEYRTTKRSNGMPVYTMVVDCGNMPSGDTHKRVSPYCHHTGWVYPISCIGQTSIGTTIPIKFVDGNEQWIAATKGDYEGHINIEMYGGVADWTATATVEYVKL